MKHQFFSFGKLKNKKAIEGYQIENSSGLILKVINYGASVLSLQVPSQKGKIEEVTLNPPSSSFLQQNHFYFGATVGRVANRIENACFKINDATQKLSRNENNKHHLHGGLNGFDQKLWGMKIIDNKRAFSVVFSYLSKNTEEGYPGNIKVESKITLNEQNEVIFNYTARTDKPTVINLTNHTYWNLSGNLKENILNHKLTIDAKERLQTTSEVIPTGSLLSVEKTPFDFRKEKTIKEGLDKLKSGFDHFYVMRNHAGDLKPIACLRESKSRRQMEIETKATGLQFYTASINPPLKKIAPSFTLQEPIALCLETQIHPDAPNHQNFPSIFLSPKEVYRQTTLHRFSIY